MNQEKTWQRLQEFAFPAGFNNRLQSETGWDRKFCESAIHEYLKFVFLYKFTGHPVTPCKAVDEVWHCHLLYTQNYWSDFCTNILERSLHHHPGNGEDDSIFEEQYRMTYESYRKAFGEPPSEFWPKPKPKDRSLMDRILGKKSEKRQSESKIYSEPSSLNYFDSDSGNTISTPTPTVDTVPSSESSFGGGQFGGSGAGADFGGSDSSTGSDSSSTPSCGSSCGSSCGGGCGGD